MHRKVDDHLEEIVTVERFMLDDADVVVVAFGIAAWAGRDAVLAAREQGIRAGLLRLITLWPFPDAALAEVAKSARVLLVAELNLGQVAREVTRAVAGRAAVVGHFRADGRPITPGELLGRLTVISSPSGGPA